MTNDVPPSDTPQTDAPSDARLPTSPPPEAEEPAFDTFETYHDRKAWLIVFGATELLVAGAIGLSMAGLAYFASVSGAAGGMGSEMLVAQVAALAPFIAFLMAVGYGSIRCRRWGAALGHAASQLGMAIGIAASITMCAIVPTMLSSIQSGSSGRLPGGAEIIFLGSILVFTFFIYLIPPVVAYFFYRSRHVKATCQMRDPKPRWTDDRPVPVLTACLALGFVASASLGTAFGGTPTPWFGRYISGDAARLAGLGTAILFLLCLFGLDRRTWWGWGLTLLVVPLQLASSTITFLMADMTDLYRVMGMSEEQIELQAQFGGTSSTAGILSVALYGLTAIAWLIYIARFMGPRDATGE